VAQAIGFETRSSHPVLASPIADYHLPGIASAPLATSLAGAVGAVIVFLLALLLARWLVPKQRNPANL